MPWVIVDTGVYVGVWEGRLGIQTLEELRRRYAVRQSTVVLSELRRGARSARMQKLVSDLRASVRIAWEPNEDDWWQAGRLVLEIGDAQHWETNKRREFQNDALIALTARRHGASIATTNHRDFRLLAERVGFPLIAL